MPHGITHADITTDEDLGRIIILRALDVAPEIRTVPDESEEKANTIAVLRRVAKRAAEAGSGAVESMGRNGTSMKFRDVGDAFHSRDLADLRRIFHLPEPAHPGPLGSFPADRPLSRIFPETYL